MRHLKTVLQLAVMWVVVFVMAAGPLPLGIPSAAAQSASGVTDTPGIRNFYTPRLFIIFDSSKSMTFRPNDPNSDPSVVGQDWDPTIPTPAASCQNKLCLGKRSLYQTLPQYTPRIEMGLSGYNQYYQLTTQPATFSTRCYYDQIAVGSASWGTWNYTVPDDLTGTALDNTKLGANSPIVNTTVRSSVPNYGAISPIPHRTRKQSFNAAGLQSYVNVVGAGYSAGSTITVNGYTYTWNARQNAGALSLVNGGSCQATISAYNQGACAVQPCDLTLTGQHTQVFPPIYSGSNLGTPITYNGNTYTRTSSANSSFTDVCTLTSPYTGGQAGCNGVIGGGCTLTKTNGPYSAPTGATATYYDASYNPGAGWSRTSTPTETIQIQLTTYGTTCPAIGTVVSTSSGPPEWQSLATGGTGPGSGPDMGCRNSPGLTCSWTMTSDTVVQGESNTHYCSFTRTDNVWTQYTTRCDWRTTIWRYDTVAGTPYCDYKWMRDQFVAPLYNYSYLPNDGDLIGGTFVNYPGNNDVTGQPNAVTYSNGSFSNGDCPNLIANSASLPACRNGAICKLRWQNNTTIGVTNYPLGRYSNGGAWVLGTQSSPLYPAADPLANLSDPLFPPNPMAYSGNWLTGGGLPTQYYVNLDANYFDPSASNPPSPPLFTCAGCSYQYSYQDPGLPLDPATHMVLAASAPAAPAAFAAVATTMPATRNNGWARLDDGTPAVSWQPIALNNAIAGATPPADGPLLRMLSHYDLTNNPTGIRTPDYGDYTPLSGSLTDVKKYLQTVIDSDPYAGCGRKYYVMLLTDGEEFPTTVPLPANDPVGAVRNLRNMRTTSGVAVDVKTFVIGFGLLAPSAELNSMAQAGGTSVSAGDLITPDPSPAGVAFDGSSTNNLLKSLNAAFGSILEGYFTRSKPAVNLAGTEMYVGYFRILFNGQEWQGKLDAINIDGVNLPTFADTVTDANYAYLWRYGDGSPGSLPSSSINKQATRTVYTSLNPGAGNRIFFDYSSCTGCTTASGWNSNAGADQTALEALIDPNAQTARSTIALLLNPGAPANPEKFSYGALKLSRASDIFHSNPAIVEGASQSPSWPDATESNAYLAFKNSIAGRRKTVYVGANDGMLHAVEDAVTSPGAVVAPEAGSERWGYVPNSLLKSLRQARDGHLYGADGSFGIADVCGPGFSGNSCIDPTGNGWKTLLVGALGKGGAGLYALDITDPTNPVVKWEYWNPLDATSQGFQVRFGETWGAPVIARANLPSKPWAVFVGGGVAPSKDGVPWGNLFFVLDARTGALVTDGVTPARFVIPDDVNDDPVSGIDHPNGVASRPTLYRPGDGSLVNRVYFNDTEGKMWRMDTSSTAVANWDPAITADPFFDPATTNAVCQLDVNGNPAPVTDATTGAPVLSGGTPVTLPFAKPRPKIFNRPTLAFDQTGLLNVYVGTGDSEHPNDPLGTQDYLYAVTDTGSGCGRPKFIVAFAQNEKVLADPAILNGVLYVTTYTPPTAASCSDAGRGFLYSFDAFTGQPVKAIIDPFTRLPTAKLDLGQNAQLSQSGIPSAPLVRNGKIFVALEADPAHPRQIDLGTLQTPVKVKGWQRVK